MSHPSPDHLPRPSDPIELTVRLMPADPDEPDSDQYSLIQGSSSALRFSGELLIATANQDAPFDYAMMPGGAGKALFSDASDLGLSFDAPAPPQDKVT